MTFLSLIPKLTPTLIIMATISMPLNLFKANKVLAQTVDIQAPPYQKLQKNLIAQNPTEAALVISERGRTRALVDLLAKRLSTTNDLSVPPSIDKIKQVAKQQNATLVEYSIITDELNFEGKREAKESELYIWVIKPTGEITFRNVDLKPLWQKEKTSLTDLIAKSRESIGVNRGNVKGMIKVEPVEPKPKPNSNEKLKKLHQLLIQPIANLLPTQPDEKIIFIPQNSLFLVPFAALPDANGKYLIEKHTISTAPSIQVLDLLYQRQQQIFVETRNCTSCRFANASLPTLVVGNPTMPSVSPKPGEKPQQLSQLLGAEEEAKEIARLFNTQALTGDVATETTVKQRMSQARIIHFATQGCLEFEGMNIPGELAFAPSSQDDGWLKSEEIMNLNLNAELVVLSSDSTALGRITGDGVIGLSRSFFAGGVPSVIGSLWSPSDRETVLLMTNFYENLTKNPDKAYALRQAMLTTMKKYPNPFDWAGFTLIGVS
ncbi:CHAT domain-containing protein [Iningainema sp. BLCCT55]|uniref:CHAT domain-containing protein n=3 Tax=Iningainema TaxID=1932705 RepID=A0A8J6XE15_9CYAN|nr:CHAT domain-containing protein [Iningainema tapete BLCC-T55]